MCRRGKRGDRAEGKKDDGTMQPPRFGFAVERHDGWNTNVMYFSVDKGIIWSLNVQ